MGKQDKHLYQQVNFRLFVGFFLSIYEVFGSM